MSDINEYLKSPRILIKRLRMLPVIYARIFRTVLDAFRMKSFVCKNTCGSENVFFIEPLKSNRFLIDRMLALPVIYNQILRAVLNALHVTGTVCKATYETERVVDVNHRVRVLD